MHKRLFISLTLLASLLLLKACAQVDLKQATYGALRKHDCRTNNLEQICAQPYRRDYIEYAKMREELMRQHHDQTQYQALENTQAPTTFAGMTQ